MREVEGGAVEAGVVEEGVEGEGAEVVVYLIEMVSTLFERQISESGIE